MYRTRIDQQALQRRIATHVEQEAERLAEDEARKERNAATRANYLAGLAAKRAEQAHQQQAAIDAELEPQRVRLERQWLADHPEKSATDFQRHAWPHLKANLTEQSKQAAFDRVKAFVQQRHGSRI